MGSMWPSTASGDGQGHVRISPQIDQVVTELAARFPAVSPEALRTVVTEEFGVFDGAAISRTSRCWWLTLQPQNVT